MNKNRLVKSVKDDLPQSEYKICARHIWTIWHKKWRGEERIRQFWRCCKASFEIKFNEELEKFSDLRSIIVKSLLEYNEEN